MRNYVEIKGELNSLELERRNLKSKKVKIVEDIENIIKSHSELLSILPKNIELIDSKTLEDRFNLLEEQIDSLNINEDEKFKLIETVVDSRIKIKEIDPEIEELDNKMIALGPELYNRKTYVMDRVLELQKIKFERESLEKEISDQKKELLNDKYSEIKISRREVISKLEEKYKVLRAKEEEIRKEENLYEDAKLIAEEKIKEEKEKEEKEKLVVVNDEKVDEENKENIVSDIDETKYVTEEKNMDNEVKEVKNTSDILEVESKDESLENNSEVNEQQEEQVEALAPEKPKKVKKVTKANFNLKLNTIKKAGKIALGVGALALTVAFFIANPLLLTKFIPQALGELGAAALTISTIKERKK